MKSKILKILILTLFVVPCLAQTTKKQGQSLTILNRNIDNFLMTWLIKKDYKGALDFFSPKAFSNKEMLNESCSGYIKPNQRSLPNHIKEGVNQFLFDFSSHNSNKTLDQWLSKPITNYDRSEFEKYLIETPKTAKYWLFSSKTELLKSILDDENRLSYLNKHIEVKNSVILLIGLNIEDVEQKTIGHLAFIWLQENNNWRIVHIGMFCQ